MRSIIIVNEDCTVEVPNLYKRTFGAGETVFWGSRFYQPLLWAGLATETGEPSPVQAPEHLIETVSVDRAAIQDDDMIQYDQATDRWVVRDVLAYIQSEIGLAIAGLIDNAPSTFDSLKEVADYLEANDTVIASIFGSLSSKAPLESPAFTGMVTGINKAMVGLGNVDNTADINKPVSTPQQNALDLKAPKDSPTFTGTVSGITKAMVGLDQVPNVDARQRSSHTGVQTASTISDFAEAVEDSVAAILGRTTHAGVQWTYDDVNNTLKASVVLDQSQNDAEGIRDTIGNALLGVGNITVTVNDAGDTITISTSATVNQSDAYLLSRANHTGSQAISTIANLQGTLDNKSVKANNLSDLTDIAAARGNLGLGNASVKNAGTASGELPILNASGRLDLARLGSGVPSASNALLGDGSWGNLPQPGKLLGYEEFPIPGSSSNNSFTPSGSSEQDVFQSTIQYTQPTSGKLLIVLSAVVRLTGTGASFQSWRAKMSSDGSLGGVAKLATHKVSGDPVQAQRVTAYFLYTATNGATPRSIVWGVGGAASTIYYGGSQTTSSFGAATMAVYEGV